MFGGPEFLAALGATRASRNLCNKGQENHPITLLIPALNLNLKDVRQVNERLSFHSHRTSPNDTCSTHIGCSILMPENS